VKVPGDWRTRPETQAVSAALTGGGHRALFVGGCVRNALLGRPVTDVDLATDAPPGAVMALAAAAGLRAVPTGIAHGTVTVVSAGVPHEVTTFRRDVETFGRHATVAFSTRIEDDAARRDFTMNALYALPDGTLVDPLHGLPDLLAGRLRFVGDPRQRIAEDHLRILRFFRFHAWYADPAGGLDAEGLAACAALAATLDHLSRERVGAEMRKLLLAPDPAPAMAAMAAAGVLGRVLPGASAHGLATLVDLEGGAPPRWLRRLAILGGADAADRLRLSRAEAAELSRIRAGAAGPSGAAELAYRHGAEAAADMLLVRAALGGAPLPRGWHADLGRGAAARFPVTADDLTPDLAGPALGRRLRLLEDRWIASGFTLERAELLALP
jgi:poly(A) polymerase